MPRSWLTPLTEVQRSALPDRTTTELVFGVIATMRAAGSIGCHAAPSLPDKKYCCPLAAVTLRATPILAILFALFSVNHMLPSGPGAIPPGWLLGVGTLNSAIVPVIVIRPTLLMFAVYSVNHIVPSGPARRSFGPLAAVGTTNSVIVLPPPGVMLPILFVLYSVNHRLPSGPGAVLFGRLPTVAMVISVKTPAGLIH